jgi:GH25 family lysozyme M1 (1,4-beta-N-acetylmuramidase)
VAIMGAYSEKGADISWWQGEVDYQKMKEAGVDFLMIRAGAMSKNGVKYSDYAVDTHFMYVQDFWPKRVGYYWFYREFGKAKAIEQARYFWGLVKDEDHSEGLVIDAEVPDMNWSSLLVMAQELEALSGLDPQDIEFYNRASQWNLATRGAPGADRYGLWIARWHQGLTHPWQDSDRYRSKPWVHAKRWQKEGDGNRKGSSHGVESADLDIDWKWTEPQIPPPSADKAVVYIKYDPRFAEVRLEETEL